MSDANVRVEALEASVYKAVRETVPIYGSGGITTYDEEQLIRQLSHWVYDLDIGRVKIKIGESWGARPERDLERIRQARRVIGDAELYVDANGAYAGKQAIRIMREAADDGLDVRWFEEPVSSDDLAGLREVRYQVPADVAAGEYGYDLRYFERMCAVGAARDSLQTALAYADSRIALRRDHRVARSIRSAARSPRARTRPATG